MKLTIVGGGSSAHVLIPLLSNLQYNVNLLTSRPDEWANEVLCQYMLPNGKIEFVKKGKLNFASNEPKDVVPDSDIIILCMPVHKYRIALDKIAPFINRDKKVFLGVIYGQAGFNWMAESVIKKYLLNDLCYFAFGLIPWICRIKEYGKCGITYGSKANNVIAVYPKDHFSFLNKNLLNAICYDWFSKGKFSLADNFISLTLSVDNQIIHPSRLYALSIEEGGVWDKEADVPFFYRDYTNYSSEILENIDNDYSNIRNKIIELYPSKRFTYMMNYLDLERFSYNSSSTNILDSFVNSKTLSLIKTPVCKEYGKYVLDRNHRFFYDDIFYGLCIAKWFAQKLSLDVFAIDKIIDWASKELNIKLLLNKQLYYSKKRTDYLFGDPSDYCITDLNDALD